MAWTTELTEQLRLYLDPTDTTYSDITMQKFISLAAYQLYADLNLLDTYTVNVVNYTISPDPTVDPNLAAIIVIKAAVIVVQSEYKKACLNYGFRLQDGKSSIDGTAALNGMKDLIKSYQKNLDKAVSEYQRGNANIGRAILSPYTSEN